jgi:hypothetical protein
MIWQDLVFMLGGFIFTVALIPSILSKDKPSIFTSLLTASILAIFCVCYAAMGFWLAFVSEVLGTIAWCILLIQKWRKDVNTRLG